MATKARFLHYTDKICRNNDGNIQDGDILLPGMIMRFKNGLLHAEGEPAISCTDGHLEYWKHGKLHAVGQAAVTTIREDANGNVYEEFWENGVHIS